GADGGGVVREGIWGKKKWAPRPPDRPASAGYFCGREQAAPSPRAQARAQESPCLGGPQLGLRRRGVRGPGVRDRGARARSRRARRGERPPARAGRTGVARRLPPRHTRALLRGGREIPALVA